MILNLNFLILCSIIACSNGDIYLHNPRGSNNRLGEAGRPRTNAKRVFDSQNNDRGGYNVGSLYYYSGSKLKIEWTNQHSCNNANSNCEFILQYMCDDLVRDGSDVRTIPENDAGCDGTCNKDVRYGMNENQEYFRTCKLRTRNKGLFIADQKLKETATSTRQNPNGERYGYECPEERDYYPYWHPTKWIDIAVLTNDPKKCDFYKNESENVKSRFSCIVPSEYNEIIPNSKIECEKLVLGKNKTGEWKESPPHKVQEPFCKESQYTRDNHLGNSVGENPATFDWTIPYVNSERCVLRIRYNISTNDYDANNTEQGLLNDKMHLNLADAKRRGYHYKTNPQVEVFSDINMKLKLAINTQQYGRVFQDRSHVFAIRTPPEELKNKKIYNLNVRGKRGNIVQVYPAVEYDFVPNRLETSINDYIHIQWTGSNTNPNNNDGQGAAGSDRSNILLLNDHVYKKGNGYSYYSSLDAFGQFGINYPMSIVNSSLLGLSNKDLIKLAIIHDTQFGGNMDELNDAGTYFDLDPVKITRSGVFHYMSTRNNNFSNRDQKGVIIVQNHEFYEENYDINGGVIQTENVMVSIPEGAFKKLTNVRIDVKSKEQILEDLDASNSAGRSNLQKFDVSNLACDFVILNFTEKANLPVELKIKLKRTPSFMAWTYVYRISRDFSTFTKMDLKSSVSDSVIFETQTDGIYIARNEHNYSVFIGSVVSVVFVLVLISSTIIFFRRNPKYLERIRYTAANAKRSVFSDKI